jgi:hypothetical protein
MSLMVKIMSIAPTISAFEVSLSQFDICVPLLTVCNSHCAPIITCAMYDICSVGSD